MSNPANLPTPEEMAEIKAGLPAFAAQVEAARQKAAQFRAEGKSALSIKRAELAADRIAYYYAEQVAQVARWGV